MVTVMGPSVARCQAISGGGRCHWASLALCPLFLAGGCTSHPHPSPLCPSISVCSPVCLSPSWSACPGHSPPPPPPMPALVSPSARTLLVVLQHDEILDPSCPLMLLGQAPVGFGLPLEWVVLLAGQPTWR